LAAGNVRIAFEVGWDLVIWFRAGPFYTPRLGFGVVARGGFQFFRLAIERTRSAVYARCGREYLALFIIAPVSRFYMIILSGVLLQGFIIKIRENVFNKSFITSRGT